MRLPDYDRLGWPTGDGGMRPADEAWWQETRERVLAGYEAPDDDDDPPDSHPCAVAGCPHLALDYVTRCPIHARKGQYR